MIERSSIFYTRVFDDPKEAEEYSRNAAMRAIRLGSIYASAFIKEGFENGRVLDVGSGGGEMLIEIVKELPGLEGVGVDLSEPLIGMAGKKAEEAGIADRIKFIKGDVQNMPFKDDSFDAVISLNVFHVLPDPVAMLDEVERVLKPDGRFGLSDIKRSWLGRLMKMLATAYSVEEVREILKRSKLRSWKIEERAMWFSIIAGAWKDL
ncbi:class I SAM-dependent methyltransferase [candidate division WOR-3 bacterium]|nr:class I SAM-dependent methyltransferase [candidate division WOR-3 bacterium]